MALAYTTNGFGTLIQSISRRGVTIVWFTTTADNSQVKLGTTQGNLNLIYTNTAVATSDGNSNYKHVMKIRGLTPNTKYFYSVGNTTTQLFGGTANEFFWTSPELHVAQPMRIWALGDYGTTGPTVADRQKDALDGFNAFNGNTKIDLWLSQGDQAYQSGCWGEVVDHNFGVYPTKYKQFPHFTTPGNHDYYCSTDAYPLIYVLPTLNELGGVVSDNYKYYSFDYGNVHVISYDSDSLNLSISGTFYKWLKADLQNWQAERNAGMSKWCIVISHYAPYSKGTHDSDSTSEMTANRANINPLLETYNVDLCLYGHSHNYERSRFIRGLYGSVTSYNSAIYPAGNLVQTGNGNPTPYDKTSGQVGTIYITNGWGGADTGTKPGWPAAVNAVSLTDSGSTVIDFDTPSGGVQNMRVRAIKGPAGTVVDDFTIRK